MVSGGHKTTTQYKLTYQSSVSWDSVKTALTISALNDLKVIVCDTQNVYLTENFWEKIWTVAGPKFGYEQGKIMSVVRVLYGLQLSRSELGISFLNSL